MQQINGLGDIKESLGGKVRDLCLKVTLEYPLKNIEYIHINIWCKLTYRKWFFIWASNDGWTDNSNWHITIFSCDNILSQSLCKRICVGVITNQWRCHCSDCVIWHPPWNQWNQVINDWLPDGLTDIWWWWWQVIGTLDAS